MERGRFVIPGAGGKENWGVTVYRYRIAMDFLKLVVIVVQPC